MAGRRAPRRTIRCSTELETLYKLGYRGHVDFVDDNLIGNKKAIKAFLPTLEKWIEQYDYPFEFTTEASLNLADDDELLADAQAIQLLCHFRRHRKPGYRNADRDAQEAEYAPQHRRQRAQDLPRAACS